MATRVPDMPWTPGPARRAAQDAGRGNGQSARGRGARPARQARAAAGHGRGARRRLQLAERRGGELARARGPGGRGAACDREEDHAAHHSRPGRARGRPRTGPDPGDHLRGGAPAAHARVGSVHPGPDPGARRDDAGHFSGTNSASTRSTRSRRSRSPSCCTTTSRPSPPARRSRSGSTHRAARKGTGRWPSGPSSRCCRRTTTSPTRFAIVSDIMESNGSSSMASVCAARRWRSWTRGFPSRRPAPGVAMGLIKEGDRVAVLTDILGLEDFTRGHGLQGGRHPRGCELDPDGHQDRGADTFVILGGGSAASQPGPHAHPRHHGSGSGRAAHRTCPATLPASSRSRSTRRRSARSSGPRARPSARSRTSRAPRSRSTTAAS